MDEADLLSGEQGPPYFGGFHAIHNSIIGVVVRARGDGARSTLSGYRVNISVSINVPGCGLAVGFSMVPMDDR